jgi:hypothetical protein
MDRYKEMFALAFKVKGQMPGKPYSGLQLKRHSGADELVKVRCEIDDGLGQGISNVSTRCAVR